MGNFKVMKIVDNIDAFLKILMDECKPRSIEEVYLLKGDFNYKDESVNIIDFVNKNEYNDSDNCDELRADKHFLLNSIKNFKENG